MKAVLSDSISEEGAAVALPEENKTQANYNSSRSSVFKKISNSRFIHSLKTSRKTQGEFIFLALLMVIIGMSPHLAGAEDLLKTQKADTTDTFGHGSTVEYMLYVGEIIISIVGFIKSRNPMVFTGMIMVLLATRGLFALAGG